MDLGRAYIETMSAQATSNQVGPVKDESPQSTECVSYFDQCDQCGYSRQSMTQRKQSI